MKKTTKLPSSMTKEELLIETERLEILSDYYSRNDWCEYTRVVKRLKRLDFMLLTIYNNENILFLKNHKGA